jgi:hypothetical protein
MAGMVSRAIERRLLSLHTCIPARVERWDASTGLVDAQPLIMAYKRVPDGSAQAYTLGVATNVPAVFLGGGGGPGDGFRGTYPVQPGDLALLFAAEASMDKWLQRGDVVDPEDQRMHNLSDGIALVGLRPAVSPWTGVAGDAATWGKDGGLQISISAVQLLLGLGAVDAVLKGTAFKSAFDSWRGSLNTYLAAIAAAVNTLTAGSLLPSSATYLAAETAFAAALTDVLSTKVKVE